MPAAESRTVLVSLRWTGPRLDRQQLTERANEAVRKTDRQFQHIPMDVQAVADEKQQFVQLIITTVCTVDDADKLKTAFKSAFDSLPPPAGPKPPPEVLRVQPAPPRPRPLPPMVQPVPSPRPPPHFRLEEPTLQTGEGVGLFLCLLLFLVATGLFVYVFLWPFRAVVGL